MGFTPLAGRPSCSRLCNSGTRNVTVAGRDDTARVETNKSCEYVTLITNKAAEEKLVKDGTTSRNHVADYVTLAQCP